MYTGNNHLVITFNSEGMKLDFCPKENASSMEMTPIDEPLIMLSRDKGMRINFIRVMYTLCKKQFFVRNDGSKASDLQVFRYLGNKLGVDLSDYCNDLSRALQDNTSLEKNLRIFEDMRDIMRDKFNSM